MQLSRRRGLGMIPGLRVVSQARCPIQREMTLTWAVPVRTLSSGMEKSAFESINRHMERACYSIYTLTVQKAYAKFEQQINRGKRI